MWGGEHGNQCKRNSKIREQLQGCETICKAAYHSPVFLMNTFFGLAIRGGSEGKCLQCRRPGFDPWVRKIPWRRKWQPTPVSLPEESHGQRSLVGYSPRDRKESDTTERLHFHFVWSRPFFIFYLS